MNPKEDPSNPFCERKKKNLKQTRVILEGLTKQNGKERFLKCVAVVVRETGVSLKTAEEYINYSVWEGEYKIENGYIIRINYNPEIAPHSHSHSSLESFIK